MNRILAKSPIVVVLGHVDHGKTTLLDAIRKTKTAEKEYGGITQCTTACQVEYKGKKITFIDTPGHEAFGAMRSRGASVADIALLVVASDDGVMPQTRESLEHIRSANIPFIVVLTKTDLPSSNSLKVKNQLVEEGVNLEETGGDVVCVEVSAKTGKGINELLESILLISDLYVTPQETLADFQGVVIETRKDRRGPVVLLIVEAGTLEVGQEIQAEGIVAKVRGIFDEYNRPKKQALISEPVEILGFDILPPVGSKVTLSLSKALSKEGVWQKKEKIQREKIENKRLAILKSDTYGALEAIEERLKDKIEVLKSEVGDVTDNDVFTASASGAVILGFNVKVPAQVKKLAEEEGVIIRNLRIIYELEDEIEKIFSSEREPSAEILGRAEIIAEFPYGKEGRIAGMRVLEGRIAKGDVFEIFRGDKALKTGVRISSLMQQKNPISKVEKGGECGAVFEGSIDFQVGDVLVSKQPTLAQNYER